MNKYVEIFSEEDLHTLQKEINKFTQNEEDVIDIRLYTIVSEGFKDNHVAMVIYEM